MTQPPAEARSDSLRVVVFTNIPGGGVYHMIDAALHGTGHRIVGVVTTPGPAKRRSDGHISVVAAVPPPIDVIVTNHPSRLADMLAPLQPDLIITGGFPWIIPESVIALPRLGTINMHPAPLPKYRGPCSVEWMFRNGDPQMGFTVHRMDGTLDTGPVLAQGWSDIGDDDDMESIVPKLVELAPDLLQTAIQRVLDGDEGEVQDEALATYAGFFEPEWREIDWTRPARTIHNQVRSWTGGRDVPHGAFGDVAGDRLVVLKTRLVNSSDAPTTQSAVGSVLFRDDLRMVIQCGDAPLELLAWSPAP